jgi:hypothetical protein
MKKGNVLAVTMAMLFVAAAFAGGLSRSGSDERQLVSTAVMSADYKVPPSNEGE